MSGLRGLERELAYIAACSIVETNCTPLGGGELSGWFDTSNVNPHTGDDLSTALLYLELRGLLERNPQDLNHVALRDECEGGA